MSIDPVLSSTVVPCRSLAEYVSLLLTRLEADDPAAAARIREVVGTRSASVVLDDERIDFRFEGSRLVVQSSSNGTVAGTGWTTRATTLDLIGGYLEVTAAVLDGYLDLIGSVDDIAAIGQAIEILIDCSTRTPQLQRLARDFWEDPCRPPAGRRISGPMDRRTTFYPDLPNPDERQLLARLNLLP
jgi:hypothetical protein